MKDSEDESDGTLYQSMSLVLLPASGGVESQPNTSAIQCNIGRACGNQIN